MRFALLVILWIILVAAAILMFGKQIFGPEWVPDGLSRRGLPSDLLIIVAVLLAIIMVMNRRRK